MFLFFYSNTIVNRSLRQAKEAEEGSSEISLVCRSHPIKNRSLRQTQGAEKRSSEISLVCCSHPIKNRSLRQARGVEKESDDTLFVMILSSSIQPVIYRPHLLVDLLEDLELFGIHGSVGGLGCIDLLELDQAGDIL